jgi:hypothetical protein
MKWVLQASMWRQFAVGVRDTLAWFARMQGGRFCGTVVAITSPGPATQPPLVAATREVCKPCASTLVFPSSTDRSPAREVAKWSILAIAFSASISS